jgi:peptidoglycan/xylan/chitin deacetylase (PgdA/CDA1 family)
MLHRFADQERGNAGHDPGELRTRLARLRRTGRELVSVDEIVRRAAENDFGDTSPIAFTVDDGYADFASVASLVFAEFDCPVTVFLVTGALDSHEWFWWDRISACFEQSETRQVTIDIGAAPLHLSWSSVDERLRIETQLMETLKLVDDNEKQRVVALLPSALDVKLPVLPPLKYAAMSWDDVRVCATHGVTFGAHTVTHPILSRVGALESRREILNSWQRLTQEIPGAMVDVFCYPNGRSGDFSEREIATLKELGVGSAVTTRPGYVTAAETRSAPSRRYALPRFPYADQARDFIQIECGIERVKAAARGGS